MESREKGSILCLTTKGRETDKDRGEDHHPGLKHSVSITVKANIY